MVELRRRTNDEGRTRIAGPSSFVLRRSSVLSIVALCGAVIIFLAISLQQLNLPGFYYDEALDLVPMLQVMHGEQADLLRGIGLTFGARTYPVMLMDYMGSLNGYMTIPFMAILGPGVLAARLQPILFSALTIVLAYALARAWFGRGVAAVTALLLAVNPSFIWFSRQGISVTSVMTVFSLGSLLLLNAWRLEIGGLEIGNWKLTRLTNLQSLISNLRLLLAGLLLGLGLWAKLLFLWWIVVLGVMTLVWLFTQRRSEGEKEQESKGDSPLHLFSRAAAALLKSLPWVVIGFAIGAAPLIYYNLRDLLAQPFDLSNAHTLGLLFKSLGQTTEYGVNNLDLWTNLGKAIADFNVFLDGSYFWYNGVPFSNVYAAPAFVISVIAGSLLVMRRAAWRKWLAVLAGIAVTVFISAFTVSGLWATHLFILVPLPQMVVAAAAVWLANWGADVLRRMGEKVKRSRGAEETKLSRPSSPLLLFSLSSCLLVALLALPVSRDLWVSEQHHAKLAETGGSGRFSDAVYKLAARLDAEHVAAPVALDWGIEKNVRVLTADRVRPVEIFGFSAEPDEVFRQRVREMLADPQQQYIVLWDRFAVYNRRQAFTEIAIAMGKQVTEMFIAHERSGLPVYVVLQAK
jgi:hypothetical protein